MSLETTRPHRLRPILLVLGSVAFAIGGLSIIAPAVARAIPVGPLLALLGNDYVLIAVFALAALGAVLRMLVGRVRTGIQQTTPPNPEEVHRVPRLGGDFDAFVAPRGLGTQAEPAPSHEVRPRLREAAIATVMRTDHCTRSEAETRVKQGTWTDDPQAASFLAERRTSLPDPGLAIRLKAAFGGETPVQQAARRTAAAIVRQADGGDR